MPNTLLTIGDMSREALMILKNELKFTSRVNRQYDDRFARSGAKIGTVANIRKPVRYPVGNGAAISPQDSVETSVPITINKQWNVAMTFSSSELTLSIDDFSERFIRPAVVALANQIDFEGLTMAYQNTFNAVGTPGTTPSTAATILSAGRKLDDMGAPRDGNRSLVINPAANASYVDALKGIFNPQMQLGDQYKNGLVARETLGFNWYMDQNVNVFTSGAQGGTPLVNGASQTASPLVTDGWSNSITNILKQGDRFTIAGVFAVNPQNRQSTGELQQFVVTANCSSNGSGQVSIPFALPGGTTMAASGAYQNVSALPADNAAITVFGAAATASAQNIAFHKDAYALAVVDLDGDLAGAEVSRARDRQTGLSLRVANQYVISTDQNITRIDVLGGWAPLYPELGCVIAG